MANTPTWTATSWSPSDAGPPGRLVVLGHADCKRVALFQEALARRGLPPARLVAWRDLLTGRADLTAAVADSAWVRIESPGRDFEVERLLLAAGASEAETEDTAAAFLPADDALRLAPDRGRILYPRQWYRGFRSTLRRLAAQRGVHWTSHPEDIITLFDKRRCQERFAAAGLPVPAGLGPVHSFGHLLARMDQTRLRRVFVKLACGSSASGVVAFRTATAGRMQAITTVELERQAGELRLYNSRRIRTYESAVDIAPLIDALCREGVQVEE